MKINIQKIILFALVVIIFASVFFYIVINSPYHINLDKRKLYKVNLVNNTEFGEVYIQHRQLKKYFLDHDILYNLTKDISTTGSANKNSKVELWTVNIIMLNSYINDSEIDPRLLTKYIYIDQNTETVYEYLGYVYDNKQKHLDIYIYTRPDFFLDLDNIKRSKLYDKLLLKLFINFKEEVNDEIINMIRNEEYQTIFRIRN